MGVPSLNLSILWPLHGAIIILACCLSFAANSRGHVGNETDRISLQAFKAGIVENSLQAMSNWNDSIHFCEWQGVTCGRRHQRVTALDLRSYKLKGSISPHIGNLSFLRELYLQNNSLANEIPPQIGRLARLQILMLHNNSLSGEVPVNLSSCSKLLSLSFSQNKLEGNIPMELGSLSKIREIIIHNNNLTGSITPLGNLSSLEILSAAENNFVGNIPDAFGRLENIQIIVLSSNRLSGIIPHSIFNCSSITTFAVNGNQIMGSLPEDMGITLPNLQYFTIADNHFTGPIPGTISNASNFRSLTMAQNELIGKVPHLENLHELEWLSISYNHLGSRKANDLSFLSSLTNATNLQVLGVNVNNFGGMLSESIGNLSKTLQVFYVDNNQIHGSIPRTIVNILGLQSLYMQNNQLTGTIPTDIGKLQNLHELNLITNKLSGNIPSSLGNLSLLSELFLGENNLQGSIPPSLGKCQNLQLLFLFQNNLSGSIPQEVVGLSSLSIYLDLAQNHLSGSLPREVGNLINLGDLDVSNNMLSGGIPSSIGNCIMLEGLHMGGNFLSWIIPPLRNLRGLQELDLSQNNLSGEIPEYLQGFKLLNLNLSFNDFEGVVPREGIFMNDSATLVMGNNKLCGGVPELQLPKCNFGGSKKKILPFTIKLAVSISCGVLGLTLISCFLYICWFKRIRKSTCTSSTEKSLLKVSYQSLLKATNGFSSANIIGVGSFGSVYKGTLDQDGTFVAVKVLNLLRQGASKSFAAECEALRNIRHRNLVKVITACSGVDYQGIDFKALVYEYMNNGSLAEWLHPNIMEDSSLDQPRKLCFLQRLNIAIDVACALDYLHYECHTPIVHCDLKPSNVLLDNEMTARVGDFGLARFIREAKHDLTVNLTSSVGVRGSIGYAAPEYGMGSEVSIHGDMYSFGILILELFTGKRPTDDVFKDGLNIHEFVKAALPDKVTEISDPVILLDGEEENIRGTQNHGRRRSLRIIECLISTLKIGVACSVELPRERMSSSDAAAQLQFIRDIFSNQRVGETF